MTAEYLKGSEFRVTVDDIIDALAAGHRPDLLMLGFYFASYAFTDEEDKQWLRARLSEVHETIEKSYLYRANIQKAYQLGLLQQAAIKIVAARFPELEQLATKIIKQITDLKQMDKVIIELSTASSQEQAKDFLLSHVSDA